jgi:hypothetical protein
MLLFVLHLEPEDKLLKASEPVANEPFSLNHHLAYIRLALQMRDGGEMSADARSQITQMVNAVPTAIHTSIRRVLETS